MLVNIYRKLGEALWVGDGANAVLVRPITFDGRSVGLEITAPDGVLVERVELRSAREAGPDASPRDYSRRHPNEKFVESKPHH